jgi:hypothetical protein
LFGLSGLSDLFGLTITIIIRFSSKKCNFVSFDPFVPFAPSVPALLETKVKLEVLLNVLKASLHFNFPYIE